MKQTVIWLALALLFAIGASLSIIADSFGPAATAETTGPATLVEAPQPVVAVSAKPAEPEVPVAMLDDVPPRPASSEALARWFVAPGAPPAAEALLAPLPLAPAKTLTGQGKPIGLMMHTSMGKGVDFMEGTHEWHGIAPNDEQLAKALAQLPETLGDY